MRLLPHEPLERGRATHAAITNYESAAGNPNWRRSIDIKHIFCYNKIMIQLFKQFLTEWNSGKNQRIKLQQAYFLIIILLAVIAGFLSLLNGDFGRLLMIIAACIAVVYTCNGIAWALLDAFVAPNLPKHAKPTTPQKSSKKQ